VVLGLVDDNGSPVASPYHLPSGGKQGGHSLRAVTWRGQLSLARIERTIVVVDDFGYLAVPEGGHIDPRDLIYTT